MDAEVKALLELAGFNFQVLDRIPRRHREDAVQEACLAAIEKRDPTNAVTRYVYHETQHEKHVTPASQLSKDEYDDFKSKGG